MRWHLMILVAAACGGPTEVTPKQLWTFDPGVYYAGADFTEASVFSRDLVVIAKQPTAPNDGLGVVALDPATGAKLWSKQDAGWLLHPPGATSPLYLVPVEHGTKYVSAYRKLLRLDPQTGAVLLTISIAWEPKVELGTRFMWSEHALVAIGFDTLAAFDWTTGRQLWSTAIPEDMRFSQPLVIGDRLYVAGITVTVFSLADGKQLAAIPTRCCARQILPYVVASPDGRHVFVPGDSDESLDIDAQLVPHPVTGEVRAASNRFYAVLRPIHDTSGRVEIFSYDRPDAVVVLAATGPDDVYSALALTDDHAFYFHGGDARFFQHDLRSGKIQSIAEIGPELVITPEVVARSEAGLDTPPVIARPYLYLVKSGVRGYLIGDR